MKHKLKHIKILVLVPAMLVAFHTGTFAQAGRTLSLSEAIDLSIKTSGYLKISNAKVDEAVAMLHQAKDGRLPDLKASGAYMRLNNPKVDLKIKLGSGGSSAPGISVNSLAYGMVNASVPVFSGFRIKYGIESAQFLEQATRLDAQTQQQAVIENTISAYSNLYKAQVAVALMEENLKQQTQRVKDFTNLEHNGVLALNDLLKAELQQSNTELAMMDAQNNLALARVNFCLMLGLPETTDVLADSVSFQSLDDAGLIATWEQKALQQRPDLQSLSMQEKAMSTSVKAANAEYYPGLAVTGGYIAANIPNLLTVTNAMNIGIGLQYNIGSLWKTSAKVDAAKARMNQVKATQGILSDGIRLQINQAYENYILSVRRIEVYKKAIDQATENYRITKNKYDNSLMTITDLLDADVAQLQARLNLATSKADAFTAYKKLQQAAGMLAK